MPFASLEPFLAASARQFERSLTLVNFQRFQACFGWVKNGSSLGYGAWLRYTKPGGKTIKVSMLLGILPVYSATLPGMYSEASPKTPKSRFSSPPRDPFLDAGVKTRSNFHIVLRQPWLLVFLFLRCIKLTLLFLPLLIIYPLMQGVPQLKLTWLQFLLKAFEIAGPTFMKFGQWMSTRRDIFSSELCSVFATLHRGTPPHSFRHTARELDRAFGKDWRGKIEFNGKNPRPVGSGCVGQVYKVRVLADEVTTQDNERTQSITAESFGPFDITPISTPAPTSANSPDTRYMDAALKILHPSIEEFVNRDLIIMEVGASILEFFFRDLRWLRLRDCVLAFSSLMQKQLDLRVEAQNLEIFRKNFANFSSVRFPVPFYPFMTKNVLMESWEDGTPLGSFISEKVSKHTKEDVASIGVDVLLKMTFIDNFVHADMHPGNIFVKCAVDPLSSLERPKMIYEDIGDLVIVGMHKRASPLQLVVIDAGLTASLSRYDFDSFKGVFAAVVKGDGDLVADKFLFHAAADSCSDRTGFRRDMSKLVHEARSRELSLSQVDVGQLLSDLFNVLVKYHVKLESNFISIMLAIMVLEGLGRSLDPNLDLLEKARPVVLRKLIF